MSNVLISFKSNITAETLTEEIKNGATVSTKFYDMAYIALNRATYKWDGLANWAPVYRVRAVEKAKVKMVALQEVMGVILQARPEFAERELDVDYSDNYAVDPNIAYDKNGEEVA